MEEKAKGSQLAMALQETDVWELLPERARAKAVSICVEMILKSREPGEGVEDEP